METKVKKEAQKSILLTQKLQHSMRDSTTQSYMSLVHDAMGHLMKVHSVSICSQKCAI